MNLIMKSRPVSPQGGSIGNLIFLNYYLFVFQPSRGIQMLITAVRKAQQHESQLTSIHSDLLQVGAINLLYHVARNVFCKSLNFLISTLLLYAGNRVGFK